MYTVSEFCRRIERDLNGFIEEIAAINRNVSSREKEAMASSYPCVSKLLSLSMKKKPELANVHVSTTDMLLEYKLPAASAWCDVVLLGVGQGKEQCIVIELKDWVKNNTDAPGDYEGLMKHQGHPQLHPSEQVKNYSEYCKRFHSVVQDEDVEVNGCVYFTRNIDLDPYKQFPNDTLTIEYPVYNTVSDSTDALASFIASKIDNGDSGFAERFEKGFYRQDRNILTQVARNFSAQAEDARPFVLLSEQREGLLKILDIMNKIEKDEKAVVIVSGPPGSGKSAVAVNLWFEAIKLREEALETHFMDSDFGNIVYVTTSSSQNNNWAKIFEDYGKVYGAKNLIVPANSFNPGMRGNTMRDYYFPIFSEMDWKYVEPTLYSKGKHSLKYEYFEDYTDYMIRNGLSINYKKNHHFLSIVDEAHALINPLAKGFRTTRQAGWCLQMGPQAYHIINESQISVFFTDCKQSFRDNETTSIADIKAMASRLGARVEEISLDKMQFRCAGSVDYVDWVEHLFSKEALQNHERWVNHFDLDVVDYPSEAEDYLRKIQETGNDSIRLLSSYSVPWVSRDVLDAEHSCEGSFYDFVLDDKNGKVFKKYWNNPNGYEIFVQAASGAMERDPLCEVGCPYVVRGFDYDYVGILWLDDLVRRNGKWMLSFKNVFETGNDSTKVKARDEQVRHKPRGVTQGVFLDQLDLIDADDDTMPRTRELFECVMQAYRILLTRTIKGARIYIKDEETREYVRQLLR
jgi:Uncharacterized conserved protein